MKPGALAVGGGEVAPGAGGAVARIREMRIGGTSPLPLRSLVLKFWGKNGITVARLFLEVSFSKNAKRQPLHGTKWQNSKQRITVSQGISTTTTCHPPTHSGFNDYEIDA